MAQGHSVHFDIRQKGLEQQRKIVCYSKNSVLISLPLKRIYFHLDLAVFTFIIFVKRRG
jgi:hypothetical protein